MLEMGAGEFQKEGVGLIGKLNDHSTLNTWTMGSLIIYGC